MNTTWLQPITLRDIHASLLPLEHGHHDGLVAAASEGELWKLWYTTVTPPGKMRGEIERRLRLQEQGSMLPFTIVDNAGGRIVGMTTYMNVDAANRRLEIGSTWHAPSAQRTAINTECKRLLLTHAFERLDCVAVELRTSHFNRQSRRAIERLGAKLDGILRNHMRHPDGTLRDTCVYSIIAGEWPAVKSNLDWLLAQPRCAA